MLMVVLSTLVLAYQNRATGFRYENQFIKTDTSHLPEVPDSCKNNTYIYDDSIIGNAYSYAIGGPVLLGNFFPIADHTNGVIKSLDMCFSSNSSTSAQSCVVYFYKADQTTMFGQSDPFINTGAAWPAGTWVHVTCPNIQYSGPFYAMVNYTVTSSPMKNYFDVDTTSSLPGFQKGFAFVRIFETWASASDIWAVGYPSTFLQRANVCENESFGIKVLSPQSISLYPNPANNVVNIVSTDEIRTIEVLNYTGQKIYETNDVNLKVTKLDVASYSAGTYLIKITTMSGIKTTKITVIH